MSDDDHIPFRIQDRDDVQELKLRMNGVEGAVREVKTDIKRLIWGVAAAAIAMMASTLWEATVTAEVGRSLEKFSQSQADL